MGCRTRVLANSVDPDKSVTPGRGNLSFTSINLPRLGIKHGIVSGKEVADMDSFYADLDELHKQFSEDFQNEALSRRHL